MPVDLLAEEMRLRARGEAYATAVVVWARSPTSGRVGDRALIAADGALLGWIGGSCSEPVVLRQAAEAIADGRPRVLHLGPAETVPPGREEVVVMPVACSSEGELEVFIEPHLPPPQVVGVGRASMLEALATMARAVGYDARVVERSPAGLDLPGVGPRSAIVVATFGRYDEDAVEAALRSDAGYVGLVASAKRGTAVLEAVRESGVAEEKLARVRVPAGLDLGHLEHDEIAAAILADVVAFVARHRVQAAPPAASPAAAVSPAAAARPAADAGPAGGAHLATDPVCGMAVDADTAADRLRYESVEYVFCGAGCRRAFERDPAGVLAR